MTPPTEAPLPDVVSPMLATAGPMPIGGDWAFEFKWDGIRAISFTTPGTLRILSRNDRDITTAYPELAELADLAGTRRMVLDGEVVALDEHGRPEFARLQERMHVREPSPVLIASTPVSYNVFDVLHLDGEPTVHLPYHRRRELLTHLRLAGDRVRVPQHFVDVDGAHVMTAAQAYGLEGVVAKRRASSYQPGRRSRDWIKVPLNVTQEVVVVGWKPGEGRRAGTFGSLQVAVHGADGALAYAGAVGTGFTGAMLRDLQARLDAVARVDPPLSGVPRDHARGTRWVEPTLVGEVTFRNWTPDGRLRHPSWRGLRPDKAPADARRISAAAPPPAVESVEGAMQTPDGRWRVEVVRRDVATWFRLIHGDDVIDWLDIARVEQILDQAGVTMSALQAAPLRTSEPRSALHRRAATGSP